MGLQGRGEVSPLAGTSTRHGVETDPGSPSRSWPTRRERHHPGPRWEIRTRRADRPSPEAHWLCSTVPRHTGGAAKGRAGAGAGAGARLVPADRERVAAEVEVGEGAEVQPRHARRWVPVLRRHPQQRRAPAVAGRDCRDLELDVGPPGRCHGGVHLPHGRGGRGRCLVR
jgi:hypothetical protein